MGYNGGTNKRGYYRRYNGMYSKSSMRSGSKIVSNSILGGLGLISAVGSAVSELADSVPDSALYKREHFDPEWQNTKYVIGGFFAILCPIAGAVTFAWAGWWMFCSILLFGFIETCICASIFDIEFKFQNGAYIYEDEIASTAVECKKNFNILKAIFIILACLNIYPIVFIFVELANRWNYVEGGIGTVNIWLVFIKEVLSIFFIHSVSQGSKNIDNILKQYAIKRETKRNPQDKTTTKALGNNITHTPIEGTNPTTLSSTTKSLEHNKSSETPNNSNKLEAIDLKVDSRVLEVLKKDEQIEVFYYFLEDLMTEESFNKQNFSINFKKRWFTYEEYTKYWNDKHWELRFYDKIHNIGIDITTNNAISLDDFKEIKIFEEKRDSLLNTRLNEEEKRVLNRLKTNRKLNGDCTIFNYHSCRDLKLDAQVKKDDAYFVLGYRYENCVRETLHFGVMNTYRFTEFVKLLLEIKNGATPNTADSKGINSKTATQTPQTTSETAQTSTKDIQQNNNKTNTDSTSSSDIKLPRISGEYVEVFKSPYGKLHIDSRYASIQFYFPGPDARYRGTHFTIWEEDIDKYIQAYHNNWNTGIKLREKAKETPKTELKQVGEMKMNIVATGSYFTVYLHHYHLPINDKKEYEDMIMLLQRAKLRIKEVRSKLFV